MSGRGRASRVSRIIAILAVVIIVMGVPVVILVSMTPSWWSPPAPDDRAADATARALESSLAGEVTHVRAADASRWAIMIREDDANAWLAARLPQWLAYERELPWPKGIRAVQVHMREGGLLDLAVERGRNIYTGTFGVQLENGLLRLTPKSSSIGRLTIPVMAWVDPSQFLPELKAPLDPVIPLSDGRKVRLVDFELQNGEVRLRFETLAAHR